MEVVKQRRKQFSLKDESVLINEIQRAASEINFGLTRRFNGYSTWRYLPTPRDRAVAARVQIPPFLRDCLFSPVSSSPRAGLSTTCLFVSGMDHLGGLCS